MCYWHNKNYICILSFFLWHLWLPFAVFEHQVDAGDPGMLCFWAPAVRISGRPEMPDPIGQGSVEPAHGDTLP